MILLRIFGMPVYIEFSFIAVWALVLSVGGESGVIYSIYGIVIHEAAHILMMKLLRIGIREVIVCGCGIRIHPDLKLRSYGMEAAVLAAGPAANLIMWIILNAMDFHDAASAQLVLGGFNLLPCTKLDGGALVFSLLSMTRLSEDRIGLLLKGIALTATAILAVAGFWLDIRNFTYYVLLVYLFFSEIFG